MPGNVTLFAKKGRRAIFFQKPIDGVCRARLSSACNISSSSGSAEAQEARSYRKEDPNPGKGVECRERRRVIQETRVSEKNLHMLLVPAKLNPLRRCNTRNAGFRRIGQGDRSSIAQPQSRFRPVKYPDTRWLIPKMEFANFAGLILSN